MPLLEKSLKNTLDTQIYFLLYSQHHKTMKFLYHQFPVKEIKKVKKNWKSGRDILFRKRKFLKPKRMKFLCI